MSEFNKEALLEEIKGLVKESTKGVITEKELNTKIEAINDQLKAINEKEDNHAEVKAMKESVDNLIVAVSENAGAIKALTEMKHVPGGEQPKNFRDALKAAIMEHSDRVLTEKEDNNGKRQSLKEYFEKGNQTSPVFTVKSAVDMLQSNIVGSNVATVRLAELDPMRVSIPLSVYQHAQDWMPSRGINKPTMSLLVVYDYENGAGTKTEGSDSSKSSFKLKTVEFKAFYISTHFVLSDETLDDLDEVLDEIALVAPDKIKGAVSGKILGTAGDDSSDIAGLFTANKKTDFAGTADSVIGASVIDVIQQAKLEAESNGYRPSDVILSPLEISNIAAERNELNDSRRDNRVVFNTIGEPTFICGLAVKKSSDIADGSLAVLDTMQTRIGIRKDMTMEILYNGTDATEGQKTAVLKTRVAFGVRDKAAVIYVANITTAINTINKDTTAA